MNNDEYLKAVTERLESVKSLGDKTIEQLDGEELNWRYNNASNSIAVIVKHMRGNMISRWTDVFTTDGEKPDRNRDSEFEDGQAAKEEVSEMWSEGWQVLFTALEGMDGSDMLKIVKIRGEGHTVMEALERQMSHYSYHVGQMVFAGKQIKGEDWQTLSIPKGESEEHFRKG